MNHLHVIAFCGPIGSQKTTMSKVLKYFLSDAPVKILKGGGYEDIKDPFTIRANTKVYDAAGTAHEYSIAEMAYQMIALPYNVENGIAVWIDKSQEFKDAIFEPAITPDYTNRDLIVSLCNFFKSVCGEDYFAKVAKRVIEATKRDYDICESGYMVIDDLRQPIEVDIIKPIIISTQLPETYELADSEIESYWPEFNHNFCLDHTKNRIAQLEVIANMIKKASRAKKIEDIYSLEGFVVS